MLRTTFRLTIRKEARTLQYTGNGNTIGEETVPVKNVGSIVILYEGK